MLSPAANGAPWLSDPLYGGMSAEAAHKSWEAGQTRDQQIAYQPTKATHPTIRCARDLRVKEFPPIRFVVPGFIVEGCTLLAGRPKLGKSWLMLHVALSVSSGTAAMGAAAFEPGDVLYLALEDNERRLQPLPRRTGERRRNTK